MTYADPRFWDDLAEDYAKKPLPNPDATARKLAITRGLLAPEHRLLDVGCGTGTIVLDLADAVAEAHGVDLSPAMIAIAERKAAAAKVTNARFHAQPAGDLASFDDAAFDCVCAYNILHLVEDPAKLLVAMHRVLAPGGRFVTSTPCLGGRWLPPYGLILPVMRWFGKAPAVQLIAPSALPEWLADAGFVDIEVHDVGMSADNLFLTARRP